MCLEEGGSSGIASESVSSNESPESQSSIKPANCSRSAVKASTSTFDQVRSKRRMKRPQKGCGYAEVTANLQARNIAIFLVENILQLPDKVDRYGLVCALPHTSPYPGEQVFEL
eukprot:m.835234 g.835234  ORF g.835234 m.835234 type:complete len:114 (-) comp59473_c0_seq11:8-349(-)